MLFDLLFANFNPLDAKKCILCLKLLPNIDYFYLFLGYGNYQTPYQHPRPDQQLPPIPPSYSQHA